MEKSPWSHASFSHSATFRSCVKMGSGISAIAVFCWSWYKMPHQTQDAGRICTLFCSTWSQGPCCFEHFLEVLTVFFLRISTHQNITQVVSTAFLNPWNSFDLFSVHANSRHTTVSAQKGITVCGPAYSYSGLHPACSSRAWCCTAAPWDLSLWTQDLTTNIKTGKTPPLSLFSDPVW